MIPMFKTTWADNLGPGETLPEFTLLVLIFYDTIQHNAVAVAIGLVAIYFVLVVFVRFTGIKVPSPSTGTLIVFYNISLTGSIILWISTFIAFTLPLIKMMEKLCQGP